MSQSVPLRWTGGPRVIQTEAETFVAVAGVPLKVNSSLVLWSASLWATLL